MAAHRYHRRNRSIWKEIIRNDEKSKEISGSFGSRGAFDQRMLFQRQCTDGGRTRDHQNDRDPGDGDKRGQHGGGRGSDGDDSGAYRDR